MAQKGFFESSVASDLLKERLQTKISNLTLPLWEEKAQTDSNIKSILDAIDSCEEGFSGSIVEWSLNKIHWIQQMGWAKFVASEINRREK